MVKGPRLTNILSKSSILKIVVIKPIHLLRIGTLVIVDEQLVLVVVTQVLLVRIFIWVILVAKKVIFGLIELALMKVVPRTER